MRSSNATNEDIYCVYIEIISDAGSYGTYKELTLARGVIPLIGHFKELLETAYNTTLELVEFYPIIFKELVTGEVESRKLKIRSARPVFY